MAHAPESDRSGADQRTISTQRGSTDHGADGVLECCDTINLRLSCGEERVTEAERYRTGDYSKLEIQQIRHRTDTSANHCASSTNLVVVCFGCGSTGSKSNRSAGGFRLERASHMVGKGGTSRLDHYVADVARICVSPVEQSAVEHNPTSYTGRDNHSDEVTLPNRSAFPRLAKGQRLGVIVDICVEPGQRGEPIPKGEVSPNGNIER
jgi:hypothetical protein